MPVADLDDDDHEWVPQPPAAPAPVQAAPVQAEEPDIDEDGDDDEEWEPQSTAIVGLAPAPTTWVSPSRSTCGVTRTSRSAACSVRYAVRPLSRGMTTRVYAARDTDSGREVAMRILGAMGPPADARAPHFIDEAQRLVRLRSEHIIEVLDTGTTSDHLSYYVIRSARTPSPARCAARVRCRGPRSPPSPTRFATR